MMTEIGFELRGSSGGQTKNPGIAAGVLHFVELA
jgi:hypothetical protein